MMNNSTTSRSDCFIQKREMILLFCVSGTITFIGLMLNALTIIVIMIYRNILLKSYVNCLILSIATSDFLLIISAEYLIITNEIERCTFSLDSMLAVTSRDVMQTFFITLQDVSFSASAFGVSILAAVRYYYTRCSTRRAAASLIWDSKSLLMFSTLIIWFVACVYVSTHYVATEPSQQIYHNIFSNIVLFIIPPTINLICYGLLAVRLYGKPKSIVLSDHYWIRRRRTASALIAYLIYDTFFCVIPQLLIRTLTLIRPTKAFLVTSLGYFLQAILHVPTCVLLPCFNPLLLYYVSSTYRECVILFYESARNRLRKMTSTTKAAIFKKQKAETLK